MPRLLTLVIPLLIASSVEGQTGFVDQSVTRDGATYRYQVYVPTDYSPARGWPLIVSLHPNGRQGSDGMFATGTAFATRVRENRKPFPALVVFPQAQTDTRWSDSDMEELVIAELEATMARFRVDPARVYLHGYSMGGSGAYRIAYRWPDRFAAIISVAGRVVPAPPNTPAEIDRDRRTNLFLAATDPFGALAGRLKSIPIWLLHGDADERVPVGESRQLAAALKSVGAAVRYTEYPGVDHGAVAQRASAEDGVLDWLFAQHR
jgi:predicted peptidase